MFSRRGSHTSGVPNESRPGGRGTRGIRKRKPWFPLWFYTKVLRMEDRQWHTSTKPHPLPQHTETAIMLRVEDRKKRWLSRRLLPWLAQWRRGVTSVATILLLTSFVAGGKVGTRDAFNDTSTLPTQGAPTLAAINNSIAAGQQFVESLLESIGDGEDVQSEASGIPFRANFQGTWVLLGQDQSPFTSIGAEVDTTTTQSYVVGFDSPTMANALSFRVAINWAYSATSYQVHITPTSVKESVQLWLGTDRLAVFTPGPNDAKSFVFPDSDQLLLRMNRFTVRHAVQSAYLYWSTYGRSTPGASQWTAALAKFLTVNGYQPGFDLRAPIYLGADIQALPDNMPISAAAYPDCQHIAASDSYAYAYHSKVCLFESEYIISGERDPFLQAWVALTVLMKHHDPNYSLPGEHWWLQAGTPLEMAIHLQGQWNRNGQGVPKCTPFSCQEDSSIRTSAFGALEAELGYCYGVTQAQRFADASAAVIVRTQVGSAGLIPTVNGVTYDRPPQAGSFMDAWVSGYKFVSPSTPRLVVDGALWWTGAHLTPLEDEGVIASNSETSFDALAFLNMYKQLKYGNAAAVCTAS